MDILNKFFREVFEQSESQQAKPTGFKSASHEQLDEHLKKSKYGDFQLTDAVRPSLDVRIRPTQGYRHDVYVDEQTGAKVPVIMAAASREILFQVFMQLVQRLGQSVDVVLETSHDHDVGPCGFVPGPDRSAGVDQHSLGIRKPVDQRWLHRNCGFESADSPGSAAGRTQTADHVWQSAGAV